ncbi:MAG TPA: hypothetical protein VKR06_46290 [Ktedonosporobacter sp.]|nr:hypothetical protein [Ktedonosporobacter sp.]
MRILIQPFFIIVSAILVRFADLAISSIIAHGVIRAICYGIIAVLALVFVVATLFGL